MLGVKVEGETLVFKEDFWKTINNKLLNAVEREEFEYWKSLAKQAHDIGIDFAEETYLEDMKNGGDEPWRLTSVE